MDTGEMAIEYGHTGGVYLADHIPENQHPRGQKSVALWIEGFSTIFGVIHDIFEAGDTPTTDALEEALGKLPKDKQKLIKAYGKQGAEIESVLDALVAGAKSDWEGNEFEAAHCGKKWKKLPTCAKHDFDWTLVQDMLAG
jgi:hypothetical protein